MKKFFIIALFSLFVCNIAFSSESKSYPKPLVVSFLETNCEECDLVELVKNENKLLYKEKVDFVNIDFNDDDCSIVKLKEKYNIVKAPTTLFIGSQMGVTKKVTGYMPYKIYQKNIISIMPKVEE